MEVKTVLFMYRDAPLSLLWVHFGKEAIVIISNENHYTNSLSWKTTLQHHKRALKLHSLTRLTLPL